MSAASLGTTFSKSTLRLDHLSQAHEERLAHLIRDVGRPGLLFIDCQEEPLLEYLERKRRLVGSRNRDDLAPVLHHKDVIEGECPLEDTSRDAEVLDLRREGEVHLFHSGFLFDPECLQLPSEDTQL